MEFPLKTVAGRLTAYLAALALLAFWVVASGPPNWGVPMPDDVHAYGIRLRTGADLFFRPTIGWYIEHGLWVALPLLGLSFVVDLVVQKVFPPGR